MQGLTRKMTIETTLTGFAVFVSELQHQGIEVHASASPGAHLLKESLEPFSGLAIARVVRRHDVDRREVCSRILSARFNLAAPRITFTWNSSLPQHLGIREAIDEAMMHDIDDSIHKNVPLESDLWLRACDNIHGTSSASCSREIIFAMAMDVAAQLGVHHVLHDVEGSLCFMDMQGSIIPSWDFRAERWEPREPDGSARGVRMMVVDDTGMRGLIKNGDEVIVEELRDDLVVVRLGGSFVSVFPERLRRVT